ncbi:MAG: Zn-dependent exopeptidase M28 [Clostridia bacterium]|nr:Zn-dependent exopeptidase M28 [Clostridia bacterium]
MNAEKIMQIIRDTAYVRTGGSDEELTCANYLKNIADGMGIPAHLEEFPVQMATVKDAHLYIDGEEIPCKGYLCAASDTVEAPLYYMPENTPYSLTQVKGKIVLLDGYLGHWIYRDIVEHGAVGFITYDGNANYADCDIDRRELLAQVCEGINKLPGVNINAKSAIKIVESGAKTAKIVLEQEEYEGKSRNVVFDLPGEIDDIIVFTAHYDSTSLSQGSYDNMSGSVGLLAMAEYFKDSPHRYALRFVLCGSEERGLLGSKAYVAAHEEEISKFALNINLDMIGSIMGKFISCCTCEEAAVGYIKYMGFELGFPVGAYQGVYSSDSTPFADKGVPAISFARSAPGNTATIHNSYDTPAVLSGEQMVKDIAFIQAFAARMANAVHLPIDKKMPDNMKEKLDKYLVRKR